MPRKSTTIPDTDFKSPIESNEPKTQDELREEALNGLLQLAQFGFLAFGDFADAGAIGMHGPPMVTEAVALAKVNSKVAKKVDLFVEVGPYAGIVAAAIPFVAQLLVNHKIFRAEQFANAALVTPATLESQMKTQVMQRAMAAFREQQRVEEEMRNMQEEMAASMTGESAENAERDQANAG